MQIFVFLPLALISFVVFVLGVFYLMTRCKIITLCVCFFFVAVGFSIYTVGFLSSGEKAADILLAALRGAFSTARMFSLNDDYSFLVDIQGIKWLTDNKWMQILFWLSHISALALIQAALISLFGRKLIDSFRLRFGPHNEVYIIKGSDKNAFLLAENIVTHDGKEKQPDKKRLIVFLLENDKGEKKIHESAARFDGIVQAMDSDHDLLYYLNKAGLGKRNWPRKEKKYNLVLMPKNESAPDDARLTAEFAKEKGVKPDNLDIFVFTSSEWDRETIEEITQTKEDNKRKYPYTFHIINEVDLLVRQMLKKHPPFECSGLGFSGAVASHDFTVMILGLGTIGKSALLHLVMNGQFVGSRMRAVIVDKNIDDLRDCFLHRYPELKLCCDMEFKNFDVQCEKFFTLLNKKSSVDYMVIALCDDEINKQTALDIRLHYERKDMLLPFIAVSEKDGSLHGVKQDEKIFTFGCREDIYKESVIIHEKSDRMAMAVNDVYKGKPWHELDWFKQESNRASADFIPAMLKLAKLNEEDAIKKDNLTDDSSLSEIFAHTEHLRWMAFHAAMGYIPIGPEEMRKRFKNYTGEKNSQDHLDFCRRDSKSRLHACLVPWNKLDKVSEVFRELAHHAGNSKEQKRDFKANDRNIIKDIPKFLKEAGITKA
jgi:hypothetical protein